MYATVTQEMLFEKYGHVLTKQETASELKVSWITLDRMRQAGKIQAKKVGQRVLFPIKEVAKFLEV